VSGAGAVIDFGARIYDSRIGRFFSEDPVKFHSWSPYQYDANCPIAIKDILGRAPGGGFLDRLKSGWNSLKDKVRGAFYDNGTATELGSVVVRASKSSLTGKTPTFGDKIRNVISKVKEAAATANIWLDGFSNAIFTNQAAGIGRGSGDKYQWGEFETDAHKIYKSGQLAGDVASIFGGATEFVLGAGGNVGSAALDATGIGAVIGVPGHIVSTGAMVHGSAVIGTASGNLINGIIDKMADNANGNPSTGGSSPQYKKKKSGQSGKEGAKGKPDWVGDQKPFKGESGNEYAQRMMDWWHGKGGWEGKGAGSEYSKIRKYGDRAFE
jgi:hypothetical protein